MINVTVREWNAIRNEMMGFNSDLKARPLTRILNMKTDEIVSLNEAFIVPDDYLAVLVMTPEGKTQEDVVKALDETFAKLAKAKKNKIEDGRRALLQGDILKYVGKSVEAIKAKLRDSKPVAPQTITNPVPQGKPKIPAPVTTLPETTPKVFTAPAPEKIQPKVVTGTKKWKVKSNVLSSALVVTVEGDTVVIEEFTGNTKPPKRGDGRILVCQVPSTGMWKTFTEEE